MARADSADRRGASLLRLADWLDRPGRHVGRAIVPLIFVMIAVIMTEVLGRYFIGRPTPWAYDVSGWLQVAYIFLGGAYALQRGYMVRVDLVFGVLPPRACALIDLTLGSVLFAAFAWVMIVRGFAFALTSLAMGETSSTGVWQGPVWPAKFLVPLGMILLSLSWLAHCARQLARLIDPSTVGEENGEGTGR